MLDDATIEQLNRGYVCPPDAGPAWRAACEYGLDMSLVEESALNMVIDLMEARTLHGSE